MSERSEFNFYFQKMLRQAGFAKGMATVPLCFIKKKKHKNYRKKYPLTIILFTKFKIAATLSIFYLNIRHFSIFHLKTLLLYL